MSALQISLAVAGGLVLAGVVAHSAWSSRRSLPKQATEDSMLSSELEPVPVSSPSSGATGESAAPQERRDPSFDMDSSMDSLYRLIQPESKPGLDALIDAIAPVVIDSPVSGEAALAALPSTRRVGSKPFDIEGLSVITGEWEVPAVGQRYSAFQCGVQLANRTGALNQIEYSEFVMKTQAFADAVGGEPEFPEMADEVARARELDQFASDHDAQLHFTLRAVSTAWSPGYVQQCAARLGFVPGAIPGRMVLPSTAQGQAPLLGLSFDAQAAMAEAPEQAALRELTLTLDVAQVPRDEQPFSRMREAALALMSRMDGVIIDDDGRLIRPEAMDVITNDLEQLYNTLDERELSAGSVLARRLFS